jgi:hypothetical protein
VCPNCQAILTVSRLYRLVGLVLSLATSLVLAYAIGLKAYAAIAWIPLVLLTLFLVPNFLKSLLPPTLQLYIPVDPSKRKVEPWHRNLRLLVGIWFGLTLYLLAYAFFLGWGAFFLGGSQRDIREITDMWSAPLGFLNSAFVITPTKSFIAVLGIMFANCFFWASVLTAVIKIVQSRLRQPITRIGLSGEQRDNVDDEL